MWVLGAIDAYTGLYRVEVVPDRKGETIRAFLKKHIKPGTKIHHDGGKWYSDDCIGYKENGWTQLDEDFQDLNSPCIPNLVECVRIRQRRRRIQSYLRYCHQQNQFLSELFRTQCFFPRPVSCSGF